MFVGLLLFLQAIIFDHAIPEDENRPRHSADFVALGCGWNVCFLIALGEAFHRITECGQGFHQPVTGKPDKAENDKAGETGDNFFAQFYCLRGVEHAGGDFFAD